MYEWMHGLAYNAYLKTSCVGIWRCKWYNIEEIVQSSWKIGKIGDNDLICARKVLFLKMDTNRGEKWSLQTRFPGQKIFIWSLFKATQLPFRLEWIRGQKSSGRGLNPWKKMIKKWKIVEKRWTMARITLGNFHFLIIFFQGFNPPPI